MINYDSVFTVTIYTNVTEKLVIKFSTLIYLIIIIYIILINYYIIILR